MAPKFVGGVEMCMNQYLSIISGFEHDGSGLRGDPVDLP